MRLSTKKLTKLLGLSESAPLSHRELIREMNVHLQKMNSLSMVGAYIQAILMNSLSATGALSECITFSRKNIENTVHFLLYF